MWVFNMILILGIVFGGFIVCIIKTNQAEDKKKARIAQEKEQQS